MCLESCFLLRLDEVSDARFFLTFHAVYGVLHATLAHHPSSVLRIIPAFLTATKCILVQAFRTDFEEVKGKKLGDRSPASKHAKLKSLSLVTRNPD